MMCKSKFHLLFLIVFVFLRGFILCQVIDDQRSDEDPNLISIPILIKFADSFEKQQFLYSPLQQNGYNNIPSEAFFFCESKGIQKDQCNSLIQAAFSKMETKIDVDIMDVSREGENAFNTNKANFLFDVVPNQHLERMPDAEEAEARQVRIVFPDLDERRKPTAPSSPEEYQVTDDDRYELEIAWNSMLSHIQSIEQPSPLFVWKRVCIIHSASLRNQTIEILGEILDTLYRSKIVEEMDSIIVVNHGEKLSSGFKDKYTRRRLNVDVDADANADNIDNNDGSSSSSSSGNDGVVSYWIEYSADTARFEIPTLQLLHRMTKYFHTQSRQKEDVQLLYLHTKGVSYRVDYPRIRDWRRLSLYFLVERFHAPINLLESGLFDAVGVNFKYQLHPHFNGNSFWTISSYVASLVSIPHRSSKYFAETWLLTSYVDRMPRVYCLHSSSVHHYQEEYPPERYRKDLIDGGSQPVQRPLTSS